MDDLAILHPFRQYFSHIRPMADDNERLCAMECCLQLRFHLKRGSNSRPLDQVSASLNELPGLLAFLSVENMKK